MSVIVEATEAGLSLEQFVRRENFFSGVLSSRRLCRQACRLGEVLLNGNVAMSSQLLCDGDRIGLHTSVSSTQHTKQAKNAVEETEVDNTDEGELFVMSLGCNCLTAFILNRMGLRTFSGPFDWIFSNPKMVSHVIKDDFAAFLDRSQLTTSGDDEFKAGHRLYSSMVAERNSHITNGVLFNHHNPSCDEGHAYFARTVERFRLLSSPNPFVLGSSANPKLFALFSVERWEPMDEQALKELFSTLVNAKIRKFRLVAVKMVAPAPPESTFGPHELLHMRMSANDSSCCMTCHELVCRGEVFVRNDRYLTHPEDHKALNALILSHVSASGTTRVAPDPIRGKGGGAGGRFTSNGGRKYADTKFMRDT
jgi:ribosomal 50S subunit-recycling heat shock protein